MLYKILESKRLLKCLATVQEPFETGDLSTKTMSFMFHQPNM